MKKRWPGRLIVALILLLGAAFSICTARPRVLPPLPLTIISERVIFENVTTGLLTGHHEMDVSPDGRYLLLHRWEQDKAVAGNFSYHGFLFDLKSGEERKLPFPELIGIQFTADGNYLYGLQPLVGDQGSDTPGVLFYDIRNRTSHVINIGVCKNVVSDDSGENLLITTYEDLKPYPVRLAVVPIAGGARVTYPINGMVVGMSRKDRAIVLNPWNSSGPRFSVADLVRGETLKALPDPNPFLFDPFHTADDRFYCYGKTVTRPNLLAKARNRIVEVLPVVERSVLPEEESVELFCFWDSVSDRIWTLQDVEGIAPGPSASSVLVLKGAPYRTLCALDLATGREYTLLNHPNSRPIRARGKYAIYRVDYVIFGGGTGMRVVLVEFALPPTAK